MKNNFITASANIGDMDDEAKRFQEAITMAYHNFHGLETRIIRIFNTYGPRMHKNDGRVMSNFIIQALNNKDDYHGISIHFVSAELDEILGLSDRIAVLYDGKLMDVLDAQDADRERVGLLMAGITH